MLETSASFSLYGGNLTFTNSFYTKVSYCRFASSSKRNIRELHILVLQRKAKKVELLLPLFSKLITALSDFTKLHPALETKIA